MPRKQPLYPHQPKTLKAKEGIVPRREESPLETSHKHDIDITEDAKHLAQRIHGLLEGESFRRELAEVIYESPVWKKMGYYPFYKRYYPTKIAQKNLNIEVLTRALDYLKGGGYV